MAKINSGLRYLYHLSFLACLLGIPAGVQAQMENPLAFLKNVKKANATSVIEYDYTVHLVNAQNKITDSSKGKLCKNNQGYLDSNNVTVTAVTGSYYFSLNKHQRTATVISIDTLKKQMGKSWNSNPSSIVAIPDSIILKYGKIKAETQANGNYLIRLIFDNMQYNNIVLVIDKTSLRLLSMELVSDDESGFKQIYSIYNIRYQFDPSRLNLKPYFTINNKQVVLNKKYSGYQLKTITN